MIPQDPHDLTHIGITYAARRRARALSAFSRRGIPRAEPRASSTVPTAPTPTHPKTCRRCRKPLDPKKDLAADLCDDMTAPFSWSPDITKNPLE